jgi:hypothetical protein
MCPPFVFPPCSLTLRSGYYVSQSQPESSEELTPTPTQNSNNVAPIPDEQVKPNYDVNVTLTVTVRQTDRGTSLRLSSSLAASQPASQPASQTAELILLFFFSKSVFAASKKRGLNGIQIQINQPHHVITRHFKTSKHPLNPPPPLPLLLGS